MDKVYRPITTFEISPTTLPDNLLHHYERLLAGAAYFGLSFPWPTFELFLESVFRQQALCTDKQALRVTLSQDDVGRTQVDYALRDILPSAQNMGLKLKAVVYERPSAQFKYNDYDKENKLLLQAQNEGFDDILRLTTGGLISEGRVANVFLRLQSGQWVTPDITSSCCLPGTTRKTILAADSAILESPCPVSMLFSDDIMSMYLCNALHPYQPVASVSYQGQVWRSV